MSLSTLLELKIEKLPELFARTFCVWVTGGEMVCQLGNGLARYPMLRSPRLFLLDRAGRLGMVTQKGGYYDADSVDRLNQNIGQLGTPLSFDSMLAQPF